MILPVLLTLLWSLVEVHSQTEFPYVSFMGENLPNHGYVDLNEVGDDSGDPGNTLRCHTDLFTCCTDGQGGHRGDWYFPGGTTRLRFSGESPRPDIYEQREAQRVDIRRRSGANPPSGIYRCDIPTIAVSDENDISVRDTVYVGLYATGGNNVQCIYLYSASINALLYVLGDINISGGVKLTKGNSQFTLFTPSLYSLIKIHILIYCILQILLGVYCLRLCLHTCCGHVLAVGIVLYTYANFHCYGPIIGKCKDISPDAICCCLRTSTINVVWW